MLDRCRSIYWGFTGHERRKKPGPKPGPGIRWLVARINSVDRAADSDGRTAWAGYPHMKSSYAVRLGRTVKSRTWVRMLDICIPFSCDTNGKISAMN
jgi:hypothetical protein